MYLDIGMPKNWGSNTWVESTKFPPLNQVTEVSCFCISRNTVG